MSEIAENLNLPTGTPKAGSEYDESSQKQVQTDKELALRLSSLIEDANSRVTPICKMIRKVMLNQLPSCACAC
jgi:hypothetical protein